MKNKYIKGVLLGGIVAFPLGINFGKDAPLLSNPFSAKPDIADKMVERTTTIIDDTKKMIHAATQPVDRDYDQ